MTSSVPFIVRLVSSSVSIANRAGSVIRDILKKGELGIIDKSAAGSGKFDPQTEADRAAQRCIIGSLLVQFPSLRIVGEEEGIDANDLGDDLLVTSQDSSILDVKCPENLNNIKAEDVVVWVDPVDGTKEFTEGLLHHATVLIGVSYEGRPVAGVIHQPFFGHNSSSDLSKLGRTLWGINGLGAFGFKTKPIPDGRRIITTTRSHLTQDVTDAIAAMKPESVLKVGGSGYKVLLLLDGDADGYIFASPGTKMWDTCACQAILEAVGGKLTDICGNEVVYDFDAESYLNRLGVVAALREHEWYIEMIPDTVRDGLRKKQKL
ncbi:3'(2'),5'-bisphosphate nucleotidase 1 [Nematostella vectensis]|uniref:3'(2'),5'-bisphosphate nucleotidase 1 n=1 Tax=Nematostella vectensis TaxID=45351 RepID=UPI0020771ECF|nr:3'(2'),5'-bisphosphate nucleotidase 1 [Nematostella vectensis]